MVQDQRMAELALKKAELISTGRIYIPPEIRVPFPFSRSTAGPGAGTPGLAFLLDNKTRIKLGVIKEKTVNFELCQKGTANDEFQIYKGDELFIDNVKLIPTLLHAPSQAFINIASECIYDCKFCVLPHLNLQKLKKSQLTNRKWAELIIQASKDRSFESVAITSAVPVCPEQTVEDMVAIIIMVRAELGDQVPVGVEPYVSDFAEIDKLHKAGATELKLNIQSYDRTIFKRICPGLDHDNILKCIEYGVKVFGRNKVCSNLIIGLGESDENVLAGIEHLAKLGVVANLRALRINAYNKSELTEALGREPEPTPPDRLVKLACAQQELLEKYDLTTTGFDTMCHKCGCCDIVPQQDI